MRRTLTPKSSLDNFKREAKRWLKALHARNAAAITRLRAVHPDAPGQLILRDVQHALALEYGFAGWTELKAALRSGTSAEAQRATHILALLDAADRDDTARATELLDAHPDIVSERGALHARTGLRTALHFAVGRCSEQMVGLLLERGADPNVRDEGDNAVPLHFAAEKEHLPIIRMLVEHGSDTIGAGDDHDLEIIGWATCFGKGRKDVVDYLLAHGARHNIFSAVATGDTDAIRANASERNRVMDIANLHRRPLHLAISTRQHESLAVLLELGVELDAVDASGITALDQAVLASESAMAGLLIDAGATVGLAAAVALGRRSDAERLLAAEPGAFAATGRLGTFIVRAAEQSPARVIERLVKAGASVNAIAAPEASVDTTRGYSALHAAAFHGNTDAVAVLIRHGANVRARDSKYCGTPAGWANYKGHTEIRDFINTGAIDLFETISGLARRIPELVAAEPDAIDKRFHEYADCSENNWIDPSYTPLMWAADQGDVEAVRQLLRHGADPALRDAGGRPLIEIAKKESRSQIAQLLLETCVVVESPDVADAFLRNACLDWRTNGAQRVHRMHDAARLLSNHPEIAKHSIHTSVAAGDVEHVAMLLHNDRALATAPGGPRGWTPIVYLCSARLPFDTHALEIATLLLDSGADPNSYYFGGNAAIHYTALTCLIGRGEEQASAHPDARRIAALLMERGAEPYDMQVLYNVFADHASRKNLANDIIWLLELVRDRSIALGRGADWNDPDWTMLDMGGYRPGARYLLGAAVDANLLQLAEWMLAHGASPNSAPPENKQLNQQSLHERALRNASPEMVALLERYGATHTPITADDHDVYVDAIMAGDRARAAEMIVQHPEFLSDHRALDHAAGRNNADGVKLLLDLGVSPNVGDPANAGHRALHDAAYAGARDAAQVLIDHGAEIDSRETHYGAIPLGVASWAQQPATVELLGRHSRDIWELVHTGRVDRIRELLAESPALARTRSTTNETPLMWLPAEQPTAVKITKMMLSAGANGGVRSKNGKTAADIASARGMLDVVALLPRNEPSSLQPEQTSFEDAVSGLLAGNFSRLEPLFVGGAESRIVEWHSEGRFADHSAALDKALSCACFNGDIDVVRYLLDAGVNASAGRATGMDAFHWAVNRGQLDVVKVLIAHNAEMETISMYNTTVLGTAVWSAMNEPRSAHPAIIAALVAAGARVDASGYPTGVAAVDALLEGGITILPKNE